MRLRSIEIRILDAISVINDEEARLNKGRDKKGKTPRKRRL